MKTAKPQQEPQRVPGVEIGDHVYFQDSDGPHAGCVRAHGKHGCTIACDGKDRRVSWDRVLGHKKRAAQRYSIIDEGEDGMIVEDAAGQRRYLSIPPDADEDKMVIKSLGADGRVLLFFKAENGGGSMPGRPGLTKKQIVDRTGRKQTKWVRANKDLPKERRPGAAPEAGADAGYGTHDLRAGDKVQFKAGDFEGSGEIVGDPGADGAHVKDASGRVHQVRWSEITGHDKNGAEKPKVSGDVRGAQEPIPADRFNAGDYAKQHDDAKVTPDAILSHFPADTKDKIADVQDRLKSIEQTIDKYKQDGEYTAGRAALHNKIIQEIMSSERIAAATPEEGAAPTFTILGGRGGSGKSWFEGNVYDPDKAIVLDADHIKGLLPEYEGWNAAQVHEESGEIFDRLVSAARTLGLNVVLDKTMKTARSSIADVKAFKDAGYKTEAHYMHLPRQEAAKRAVARFLGKTNRYVPVEVVLSNTTNEDTFDQVRSMVDKWSFRDNNVPHGQQPILISESGGQENNESQEASLTKSHRGTILMLWRKK